MAALRRCGAALLIVVLLSIIGSFRVDIQPSGVSMSFTISLLSSSSRGVVEPAEDVVHRGVVPSAGGLDRSQKERAAAELVEQPDRPSGEGEQQPESELTDSVPVSRRAKEPPPRRIPPLSVLRDDRPPPRRSLVDHIPNRIMVRQAKNISHRVFAKYLPQGQRLFCPSYDDDPSMRHFGPPQEIKPRGFRTKERRVRVIRNIIMGKYSFIIDGCPAPVTLKRVSHPPMVRKSGYRYGCLDLRVSHTLQDVPSGKSVIVERAPVPRIIRRDVENKVIPKEDVYSTVPNNIPQSKRCLEQCLKLPCCVGFQLFNSDNGTFRLCHLLECDYGFPDSIPPDNDREVALITHRREYRPSLVISEPRLTIMQGPNSTLYVDRANVWPDVLQVRLHMGFGELLRQEGLVACCLREAPLAVKAINNVWSSKVANGVPGEFFGDLSGYIGRNVTLHCETTPNGEKTCGRPLTLQLSVPVMRLSENMTSDSTLAWGTPEGQPASYRTFRGDECAAMLRASECCLAGLSAKVCRLGDLDTIVGSPALTGVYVNVSLHIPDDGRTCVEIVDGSYSYIDERSTAAFPNLVVRHWCTEDELGDGSRFLRFMLHTEAPVRLPKAIDVPLGTLRGCHGSSTVPPPFAPSSSASSEPERPAPILVSILVHQEMPVVITQLENIRFFVPGAITVLHFSGDWIVSEEEWFNLTLANKTDLQGSIFVNRYTMPLSGLIVANGHAQNILFMLREMPHVDFSHVMTLASNEMFVRHGVADYVRRFDLSSFSPPTRLSGQQFLHAHGERYLESWPIEANDAPRFDHPLWPFGPYDVFRSDFTLAEAMRRRNLTKYRTNQFYMEGAFFSKKIAEDFGKLMAEEFSPDSFCLVHWLAPSEVMPPVLMQDYCSRFKCGEHVSMMLWRNDKYFASWEDIRRIRCSPFGVPFAVKRVARKVDDEVRVFLMALQRGEVPHTDPRAVRELDDVYCRNISLSSMV
jgi:hypothetical protein